MMTRPRFVAVFTLAAGFLAACGGAAWMVAVEISSTLQAFAKVPGIVGEGMAASVIMLRGVQDRLDTAQGQLAKTSDSLVDVARGGQADLHSLVSVYAALPDQLGQQLRHSWTAIEPEITCRQADGTGYGGCWHSRVSALMGEAARVGGTFTQRFPEFADSTNGIASSFASITSGVDRRFFNPPPRTRKQKIGDAIKDGIWMGSGFVRLAR